ncbi:protein rep [Bacillus haikouensis]|nr:protein rep [Bacillus haikouensis]
MHRRLLELWQEATQNPTITQVDIRKVKENNSKELSELAKYSAKDTDYMENPEVFETFYRALKGKRLIVFSGVFKDALKKFECGELDKYREKDTTVYLWKLLYTWGKKEYALREMRLLTEEQQKELNQQLIDEKEDN